MNKNIIVVILVLVINIGNIYANDIPNINPVDDNKIFYSQSYGKNIHAYTRETYFHKGLDIVKARGTKIIAPADGFIEEIGNEELGRGKYVEINHRNGFKTIYNHLDKILVKKNQEVSKYMLIGLMGKTGLTNGAHLHYEVLINGINIDPEIVINLKQDFYKNKTIEEVKNSILSLKPAEEIKANEKSSYAHIILIDDEKYDFLQLFNINELYNYKKWDYETDITYEVMINNDYIYKKNEEKKIHKLEIHTEKIKTYNDVTINDSLSTLIKQYGKPEYIKINNQINKDFLMRNYNNEEITNSLDEMTLFYSFKENYKDENSILRLSFVIDHSKIIKILYEKYPNSM